MQRQLARVTKLKLTEDNQEHQVDQKHKRKHFKPKTKLELFDILENSKSNYSVSIIPRIVTTNKCSNTSNRTVNNLTASKVIYWDQNSKNDVKLFQLKTNQKGQQFFDEIVIQTGVNDQLNGSQINFSTQLFFSSAITEFCQ
ncbi:Hypothetical_protein [Hexamita inflata]|uniref:Hypothetical_protein n=1 Tax=Hexamita inflata TaxID=28002 RepID=A0ABP1GKT9_9EUKA